MSEKIKIRENVLDSSAGENSSKTIPNKIVSFMRIKNIISIQFIPNMDVRKMDTLLIKRN